MSSLQSCKDTVDDAAALDVSALGEVKLDEFSKSAGVVVVNGFGIPKRFHDGTVEGNTLSFHSFCTAKAGGCVGALRYLLCTMACSTRVLFSDGDVPAEFWLITDRN